MKIRSLLKGLWILCLCLLPRLSAGTPLAIAAAGDLRGVLEEIRAGFEAGNPGVQLQLTFGASGSLAAQIQQGAPFDVFLSADSGFPEQLSKAGLVTGEGVLPYATGCLTLWVRKDLGLDPAREGLKVLRAPAIRKIATANPATAPYGRSGDAALRQAGLYEAVKDRLVFGENIAQAAQFLQTGAAEAGLISYSQASALKEPGILWKVPAEAYPPLHQALVILKRCPTPVAARAFTTYLLGTEGQTILARHGFGKR